MYASTHCSHATAPGLRALARLSEQSELGAAASRKAVYGGNLRLASLLVYLFAYGPADTIATTSSLAPIETRMVCLSGVRLRRLSWENRPLNGCSIRRRRTIYSGLSKVTIKVLCQAVVR